MTTAVQQESRKRITRTDFQRRGATESQRAALRGMWGKSKPDSGILVYAEGVVPDPRSDEACWCERCEKESQIMHWPGRDLLLAGGWVERYEL